MNRAKTNELVENDSENLTAVIDGLGKTVELGDNDAENDKKVEAVSSPSNEETKKIIRKRKKNVKEASAHTMSSLPKTAKKKMNDASAMKIEEAPLCDKSTEGNGEEEAKSDDKPECIGKVAVTEDEVEKKDGKDIKVGKKVEGMLNKAAKIAKQKIVVNAKSGSSNTESAPTESPNVAAAEATSDIEENAKKDVKADENLTSTIKIAMPAIEKNDAKGTKGKNLKKKEKRVGANSSFVDADKMNNADKPSPFVSDKLLKKVDGMGLIFMCNAKTKKDCFKYNVFGLPKSKKALVAKIYKGMRLFLFDFDLKLLYGIYKATSHGGYNIEPKAFDSKFPSQVRFSVLSDCLPLPEEKLKIAIKDNYTRNKFDCQLSPEQVRKLCKLFQNVTGRENQVGAVREVTMPSSRKIELKRRLVRRDPYPSTPTRARYLSSTPQVCYLSPPPRALPLQAIPRALLAPHPLSYTYERPGDDHYYRREVPRFLDLEIRPRDLSMGYRDSYGLYREPTLYREPAYPPSLPLAYPSRPHEYGSPPRYFY